MGEKLTFRYDRVGDILHIDRVSPYREQDSDEIGDEIGDEIVARMNPDTGDIENLEILFFSKRLAKGEVILELPIAASLRLTH